METRNDPGYFTAAKNVVMLAALDEILIEARKKGVEIMLLKGAALIARGVFKPGERDFCDLDLLVREPDYDRCEEMLSSLGYQRTLGAQDEFARGPSGPAGLASAVDLHHQVFQFVPALAEDPGLIWESSASLSFGSEKVRVPSPEWLVLTAIANSMLHDGCLSSRAIHDVSKIAAVLPLDWGRVLDLSARLRLNVLLQAALANLPLSGLPEIKLSARESIVEGLFLAAAAQRAPNKRLQFLLPPALDLSNLKGRIFPDQDFFKARGLKGTWAERIRRPLHLAQSFLNSYTLNRGKRHG